MLTTCFRLYLAEQVGALADPEAAFAETAQQVSGNFAVALIWCFACTSGTSVGDAARVERCGRRVLEAEGGETLGFWGSQARMFLGAVLTGTGRADEGRALFDTGLAAYRASGMRVGVALMLAAAASAEVVAGDLERAARHLREAEAELLVGERYAVPAVLLASADVGEATGESTPAVRRRREEAQAVAEGQGAVGLAARARAAQQGERWTGVDQVGRVVDPSTSSPSSA